MFWLILGIVLLFVGICFGIYCIKEEGSSMVGTISIIVAIILMIACSIISCIHTVPTGHTGVVTTFGKVEDYTLDAGINFNAPWVKVINMDNRVQKRTVQLSCFSSDIQEVNISYTANYQIDKANAMNIYKTVGKEYYDTIIAPNIAETVKEISALYTAENLVNSRAEMADKVEALLAERLLKHNIELVNTAIEDMDFTDAFTNAVEAKQVAQQNKLKAETEAEQKIVEAEAAAKVKTVEAEAKAEADKIAAEAEAYQIAVKANAEAEANQKIAQSLTNALIDYEYAQSWDGKLPTYMSGENGFVPVMNMN